MKTRIIYPDKIWLNKKFNKLSTQAKVFSLYLITNRFIELTPIYKCPDLAIQFDLNFNEKTIEKLKNEIQETDLFRFCEEWVFVNNDFSYTDYFGQLKVLEAKEKEISLIPQHILTSLKEVIKGLDMGYKPNINTKSGIINHKSETINPLKEEKKSSYKTIESVKEDKELINKICADYGISHSQVLDAIEDVRLYCGSHGKKYEDYNLTVRSFIRQDLKAGKIEKEKVIYI